jgi:hypothetical protein
MEKNVYFKKFKWIFLENIYIIIHFVNVENWS